jgi:hypothetical protein
MKGVFQGEKVNFSALEKIYHLKWKAEMRDQKYTPQLNTFTN